MQRSTRVFSLFSRCALERGRLYPKLPPQLLSRSEGDFKQKLSASPKIYVGLNVDSIAAAVQQAKDTVAAAILTAC